MRLGAAWTEMSRFARAELTCADYVECFFLSSYIDHSFGCVIFRAVDVAGRKREPLGRLSRQLSAGYRLSA